MSRQYRIVLTGGPGGGKTTAADLLRREVGDRIAVVPEAATLLFSGGFPRSTDAEVVRSTQNALYHTQRSLEDVHRHIYPDRILLCDRGTVDGGAYWPEDDGDFFEMLGTSLDAELARYDAVLFFETAAAGGIRIEGGNRVRTEDNAEALALDLRLQALWSKHPRYAFIAHSDSFFDKLQRGFKALTQIVDQNHLVA